MKTLVLVAFVSSLACGCTQSYVMKQLAEENNTTLLAKASEVDNPAKNGAVKVPTKSYYYTLESYSAKSKELCFTVTADNGSNSESHDIVSYIGFSNDQPKITTETNDGTRVLRATQLSSVANQVQRKQTEKTTYRDRSGRVLGTAERPTTVVENNYTIVTQYCYDAAPLNKNTKYAYIYQRQDEVTSLLGAWKLK